VRDFDKIMTIFKYEARDKTGRLKTGSEVANNRNSVVEKLRQQDLFPISIEPLKNKTKEIKFSSVAFKDQELVFFTRQISNLLDSGVSLVRALSLLINQTKNPNIKAITTKIYDQVSGGGYFWESLNQYPRIFSRLYIGMVKAGETGGNLEKVMENLADFMEQKTEVKQTIISMLIYPVVVLLVGLATVIFLMSFIIPKMLFIFSDLQQSLPAVTKVLIASSTFLTKYWWLVIVLFAGLGIAIKQIYRQEKTRLVFDELLYKSPLIGEILQKITFSRLSYVLGLLLSNGLSILDCLDISKDIIANSMLRQKVENMRMQVSQGSSLSESLGQTKLFPQVMVDMIGVGEETGRLEQALLKIARVYEKETTQQIKRMLNILEPALILFMALIVGMLVMAILLPLFEFNLQIM